MVEQLVQLETKMIHTAMEQCESVVCFAFNMGGPGTRNAVQLCKDNGIEVVEYNR